MSTGATIIKDALQAIGAHSIVSPADPDSINLGMRRLNSMLEMWQSKDIVLGTTPLRVPGDELNEPADSTNAIVANLAMDLSPDFDNGKNTISPALARAASVGMANVVSIYKTINIPDKVVSSTLPVGAGNSGYNRRVYKRKGSTVNG